MMSKQGKWPFIPAVDGDDIVVRSCVGTRFGGVDDDQDNGIGAWGFPVRKYPNALLCALPIRCGIPSLRDSPLPAMTGLTAGMTQIVPVRIHSPETGKSVVALLADIGPSGDLGRGIDMSNAVVRALGLTLGAGVYTIDYRVFGAGPTLAALQAVLEGKQ